MAFTSVALTGTVELEPGVPVAGARVTATLSGAISDGVTVIGAYPPQSAVTASNGTFSLTVPANDDTTTTPANTFYKIAVTSAAQVLDQFNVVVPHTAAPTVALYALPRQVTPGTLVGGVVSFNARTGVVTLTGADVLGAGGVTPSVVVPLATGVVATDTANLQAALSAVPLGGRVWIPSGHYKINAALTVTAGMTIEGDAAGPTFKSITSGGSATGPNSPYAAGTVIEQTVAGTDILDITGSGVSVDLRRLGLIFTAGLSSTGHAVNATPAQTYGSGHDMGVTDFHWEDLVVANHDGNHYAFVLLNPQYGSIQRLRSYGGGGLNVACDLGPVNAGNIVCADLYVDLHSAGSANGVNLSAASASAPGNLNLLTFIRPQVNLDGAARTQATQLVWNDLAGAATPQNINVFAPDLENSTSANYPVFGSGTQIFSPYVSGVPAFQTGVRLGGKAGMSTPGGTGDVTAVGFSAAASATAGQTTAVGYQALASLVGNAGSTAIGTQAGQFATGASNTMVGATALLGVSGSTTGQMNTAIGNASLYGLTTGNNNTALGQGSGQGLTTGGNNTFVGQPAGYFSNGSSGNAITTGSNNTFLGYQSGSVSGNISQGTALGSQALAGAGGTSVGYQAKSEINNATALGAQTVASGNPSVALGNSSQATASWTLALGPSTQATAAGAVALGADHTGAAATSGTQDLFVLGTSLHTVKVPGAFTINNNVLYVAAPTGVTATDTTNIQAALNAATSRQKVRLAAGTYSVTTLTVNNACVLDATSATILQAVSTSGTVLTVAAANTWILGGTWDAGGQANDIIHLNADDTWVTDAVIQNGGTFGGGAAILGTYNRHRIQRCRFGGTIAATAAVQVAATRSVSIEGPWIDDNYLDLTGGFVNGANGPNGINVLAFVSGGTTFSVNAPRVRGNKIRLPNGAASGTCQAIRIDATGGTPAASNGVNDPVCTNNWATGGNYGIGITVGQGGVCSGNTVYGTVNECLEWGNQGGIVCDNVFDGGGTVLHCIIEDYSSNGTTYARNILRNYATDGLFLNSNSTAGPRLVHDNWIYSAVANSYPITVGHGGYDLLITDNYLVATTFYCISLQNYQTGDRHTVTNNRCKGATLAVVGFNGPATQTIDGCAINNNLDPGIPDEWAYNSNSITVGNSMKPVAQTVSGSPYTYTNSSGLPQLVSVLGGTVSSVQKKLTNINTPAITVATASPAIIRLQQGESIVVTYSSTPSVVTDHAA